MKVREYAKLMGLHPESVRRSIRNGEIPAEHIGREWIINDDFADAMIRRETRFMKAEESAYIIRKRLLVQRSQALMIMEAGMRAGLQEIEKVRSNKLEGKRDFPTFDDEEEHLWNFFNGEIGVATYVRRIDELNIAIQKIDEIITAVEPTGKTRDDWFAKMVKKQVQEGNDEEP